MILGVCLINGSSVSNTRPPYYQLNDRNKLIGGVHNLFEEVMITSRVPEGAGVNAPREFYMGFEILWEPRETAIGGKSVVSK